jgi:hypothetical protein
LFETNVIVFDQDARSYDVTSDGQRFIVDTVVKAAPPSPVNVILNWTATLKQ